MNRLLTPLLLLVSTMLLQCGCTDIGAIIVTGLRVDLTGIERAADGTVSVSWQVVNTNIGAYLVASVNNTIYLDGKLVGTCFSNEPTGVQTQGNAAQKGRLTLAGPEAERILTEAAAHGSASYRVDSKLRIQLYGDETSKGQLTNSGSVAVVSK